MHSALLLKYLFNIDIPESKSHKNIGKKTKQKYHRTGVADTSSLVFG